LDHDANFLTDVIVSDLVVHADQLKSFSLKKWAATSGPDLRGASTTLPVLHTL